MNVKLLRRVQKSIREMPARFNMSYFGESIEDVADNGDEVLEIPPCCTQACIAGETCLLGGKAKIAKKGGLDLLDDDGFFDQTAKDLLKITDEQKIRLFYFKGWEDRKLGWPKKFERAYDKARTPEKRAEVACKRIDYFIETGK